jgi:hypothetical protein
MKVVTKAIWEMLGPITIPVPKTEHWRHAAEEHQELWIFRNCFRSLDGKHVNIPYSIKTGSTFYNFKGNNSIVLLALVNANYTFVINNVG